jgi:hypothetical protein
LWSLHHDCPTNTLFGIISDREYQNYKLAVIDQHDARIIKVIDEFEDSIKIQQGGSLDVEKSILYLPLWHKKAVISYDLNKRSYTVSTFKTESPINQFNNIQFLE